MLAAYVLGRSLIQDSKLKLTVCQDSIWYADKFKSDARRIGLTDRSKVSASKF